MATLHIQLLHTFVLRAGDEAITSVNTPRLQSLLAYLLLHRHESQSRRQIAVRFWPDSTDTQARTNLRQLVHYLRHALPDADTFLSTDAAYLQWQPEAPYTLDVAAFETALAQAEQAGNSEEERAALEHAVSHYTGDLLPDCYDEWIVPERERLTQQHIHALERLIALLTVQQAYQQAIPYAQRLLRTDPLNEAAYRTLMDLYARSGDRGRALRVYHTCATTLQRELGVAPDTATSALYERLTSADAPVPATPTPRVTLVSDTSLVGRHTEYDHLRQSWQYAEAGHAHLVLVAGEAGIGKTRLVEELLAWAEQAGIRSARARCYAAEGRLAYGPIIDWLRSDPLRALLSRLEPVWLTELARLLPELLNDYPDLSAPEIHQVEVWERQRLFEALARAVLVTQQPLLLLVDDIHWCDRETLEWLRYLLRFDPDAPLLVVGAARSGSLPDNPALLTLLRDLRAGAQLREIELTRLTAAETAALAARVAGHDIDSARSADLFAEAEGNPLFVVEIVRAGWSQTAEVGAAPVHTPASLTAIPPKVYAVIETRLTRLSAAAGQTAELAASIGREFRVDVLAQASDHDEDTFVRALDELWQHRIVREQGAESYDFSHDKIREVAAARITLARRRLLHRRVMQALEMVYVTHLDSVSGQLAYHAEQAGLHAQAISYYQRAGDVAQRVYANEEAITAYTRGLALLEHLPDTPEHSDQEITLRIALGPSLIAARGYAAPDVQQNYARARTLCEQREDTIRLFPALWGLWVSLFVREALHTAYDLGKQCLHLVRTRDESAVLVAASFATGTSLFHLGRLVPAHQQLDQAITNYTPRQHATHAHMFGSDIGVFSLMYDAHTLWHLGHAKQSYQRVRDALALADELAHPFSQAIALIYAATLDQFQGNIQATQHKATRAIAVCQEWGFVYYLAWATILHGWALSETGQETAGITQMEQGLADLRATAAGLRTPYYLTLLAEAYLKHGDLAQSQARADEALRIIASHDERWCAAKLYRLQGTLLRQQGADAEIVERWVQRANEVLHQNRAPEPSA
jgi:DNA-binding SARP family transcriptional activator/predicted ATPase